MLKLLEEDDLDYTDDDGRRAIAIESQLPCTMAAGRCFGSHHKARTAPEVVVCVPISDDMQPSCVL